MKIHVHQPSSEELKSLGVFEWPIWTCAPSEFDWHYDQKETCYLLEGRVTVEAEGEAVAFGKGDLVVFPAGMTCVWKVSEAVRKHYCFE